MQVHNRQLIFGLSTGASIALLSSWLAAQQVIPWTLSLIGLGLIALNGVNWIVQQRQKLAVAKQPLHTQPVSVAKKPASGAA